MNALVFFVRHRSVDLVGMTAAAALRERMGYRDRLLELRRDDVFALEAPELGDIEGWVRGFTNSSHWFNPNKHRYALYAAGDGAIAAAGGSAAWPRPWIAELLRSDRPDLLALGAANGLASWQAMPGPAGSFVHAIVSWDLEEGIGGLPAATQWPLVTGVRLLRAQLWSARLRGDNAAQVAASVQEFALTRSRSRGLLVQPHVEGWASLG